MAKRKILIPLDGTEFRSKALSVVTEVFDANNTEVVLLLVESTAESLGQEARYYHGLAEDMWYYSELYHEHTMEEEQRAEKGRQKELMRKNWEETDGLFK